MTVDRRGTVDKTGVAHISGTVTCSSGDVNAILFDVFGEVRQRDRPVFITGFFDAFLETPCDGSTQPWDAFVFADNGLFAGGKAATIGSASVAMTCAATHSPRRRSSSTRRASSATAPLAAGRATESAPGLVMPGGTPRAPDRDGGR